jgi:hypothetical protein
MVPRSSVPRRWFVESSFMIAKGSPSSGTTATTGRSQGCTSTWKFVAHWKKSLVRKASASSPFASIIRRISPRRYSKVFLVRNAIGLPLAERAATVAQLRECSSRAFPASRPQVRPAGATQRRDDDARKPE